MSPSLDGYAGAPWLKSLALRFLPAGAIHLLKKRRYLHFLQKADLAVEPDLTIVKRLVVPGDLVFDVGSNIGLYTMWLSRWVGDEGYVVSIEPVPETFAYLTYNIQKLGLSNVQALRCAASSATEQALIEIPQYPSGAENFYQARIVAMKRRPELRYVAVQTRTIDSIVGELGRLPSFIKCDVEGHEQACLEGASTAIEAGKPALLLETDGDPEDSESPAHAVFYNLGQLGYHAHWYDGKALRRYSSGDASTNYFFLTKNHEVSLLGQR